MLYLIHVVLYLVSVVVLGSTFSEGAKPFKRPFCALLDKSMKLGTWFVFIMKVNFQ